MKMTVTNSINKVKEYNQKNWIDPLTRIAQALSPRSTVCFCTDYRNNKYLALLLNVLLAHDITVHLCNKHTPDIFDMISESTLTIVDFPEGEHIINCYPFTLGGWATNNRGILDIGNNCFNTELRKVYRPIYKKRENAYKDILNALEARWI